jgi:hypothetical protein
MPWPRLGLTGLRRFTVVCTALVVVILGVNVGMQFFSQTNYFASRNFRILSAIGSQIDDSVANHSRVFASLLVKPDRPAPRMKNTPPPWFVDAKASVPILQYLDNPERLPDATLPREDVTISAEAERRNGEPRLVLTYRADDVEPITLQPKLQLLAPIFQQRRYVEAFEMLALATATGEVIMSSAHQRATIRIADLSALTDTQTMNRDPSRFSRLARSTSVVDVSVNGSSYKLFLQPCCASLLSNAQPDDGNPSKPTFVVAGLVSTGKLRSASLAVPFSLAFAVGTVLAIAIVSWPFLKLTMMGDTQRVRATHVLAVVTSVVGGVALLTVVLLDVYAYRRLGDDIDHQLASLAQTIKGSFDQEVWSAYAELGCLVTKAEKPENLDYIVVPKSLDRYTCQNGHSFRDYEVFSLVDRNGMQRVKWATANRVSQPIDVAERAYFRETVGGRSWTMAATPASAAGVPAEMRGSYSLYIESVRSWTNGQLRAVLATPTDDDEFPVAMLTIRLDSLINSVVPPGFQFAVVDETGAVVFHSDSQRSQNENLFAETDFNQRLQAAMAVHRERPLNVWYWGARHRAFVMPMAAGTPWSLVTLYDKYSSGTLHEEWLVATFAPGSLYMVACFAALAYVLLWRGTSIRSCAWPQAGRFWQYIAMIAVLVSLHATFWWWLMPRRGTSLVLAGFTMPILACVVIALLFRGTARRKDGVRGWFVGYVTAAVLGVSVIAVLPAVAFFTAAHDVHLGTYTKYRQLKLAQSLVAHRLEAARADGKRPGPSLFVAERRFGDYLAFFFHTKVSREHDCRTVATPRVLDTIPDFLEDWLPYKSEASVLMHELSQDGKTQDPWRWSHGRSHDMQPCLVLHYGQSSRRDQTSSSAAPDGFGLTMTSEPPRLFSPRARSATGTAEPGGGDVPLLASGRPSPLGSWGCRVELGFIIGVLAVVCWSVVWIVYRKLLLIDIAELQATDGVLASLSGENEWLLLNGSSTIWTAENCCRVNLPERPTVGRRSSSSDPWHDALLRVDRCEEPTVVVDDIDAGIFDAVTAERKLAFLEEICFRQNRTIVIASQLTPGLIANRHPSLKPRWERLCGDFLLRDLRRTQPLTDEGETRQQSIIHRLVTWLTCVVRELRNRAGVEAKAIQRLQAEFGGISKVLEQRRRQHLEAILRGEGSATPHVARICDEIRRQLGRTREVRSSGQLLDMIGERAAAHYRELWSACTPSEKLVLAHLAKDGLVNAKCRLIVKRLMVKGMVRSQPPLVLMNQTFERFVRSAARQSEVAVLEGACESSAWDQLRAPFTVAVGGCVLFFVVTQKELFDSTIAAMAATASTIPAFVRAIGLSLEGSGALASRKPSGTQTQNT